MTEQWRASTERPAPDRVWSDDDELFDVDERSASYPPDSLVTFRFLWDAVRRHVAVWLTVALAGVVIGLAIPYVLPPAVTSSTKLVMTHRPGDDPTAAMATDLSLVTTKTIAGRVIRQLKLKEKPDELLKRYTAVRLTDRVLQINATAPTGAEANKLADTIAQVFLKFRAEQIALQLVPLRKDLATARTAVIEAEADYRAAGGDPRAENRPNSPEAQRLTRAEEAYRYIDQQILDQKTTATQMNSSRILDRAAVVPQSTRRQMVLNVGAGLVVGLFLGIGFVVVRALVSDRLWKRQDIASSLGAPVRLSLARPPRLLWRPFPADPSRLLQRRPEVRFVIRHLSNLVTPDGSPRPTLAIVSVDKVRPSALTVAALAMSLAGDGKRVLVADLTEGRTLGAVLGAKKPGTHDSKFNTDDVAITVYVPPADAGPAEGLLSTGKPNGTRSGQDDDGLIGAWAAADVVLTLATLSPAIGAEHLRTWSAQAAVLLTAGRSSATKIHATGEMLRLAGIRLRSAIVLRADRTDESIGASDADPKTEATSDTNVEMIGR